jgi:hypothetical protein
VLEVFLGTLRMVKNCFKGKGVDLYLVVRRSCCVLTELYRTCYMNLITEEVIL